MDINSKYVAAVQKHGGNPTAFFNALDAMAKRLGIPVEWICNVIWIESGFNQKAKNSQSTASGLIQMLNSNCIAYAGVSYQIFLTYTNIQQLKGVEGYFKAMIKSAGKPRDWFETYCLVFQPVWVGKADSVTLSQAGYSVNKYIDLNKDGKITKGEFRTWANKQLPGGAVETIKK